MLFVFFFLSPLVLLVLHRSFDSFILREQLQCKCAHTHTHTHFFHPHNTAGRATLHTLCVSNNNPDSLRTIHSAKMVSTTMANTTVQAAPFSEKSFQKSAPQRLMPQRRSNSEESGAPLLLKEISRFASATNSQRNEDTTAAAASVPSISDWVTSSTHPCSDDALPDSLCPCAAMSDCNRSVGDDGEEGVANEEVAKTGRNQAASLRPLLSLSKCSAPTSSANHRSSSLFSSSSSSFPSTPSSHTFTSPSSRSYPLFIHSHLPHFTFLPLLLAALFFICVAAHSSASAAAIFGQKKADTVTDSSSSVSSSNSLSSTLPSVPAVSHIKSSSSHHSNSAALHPNQPLAPLAAPPPDQQQQHSIQERLNPIEMMMLSNLINQKQHHHPEYHYRPSHSAYAEHIFDPSSEEITVNLESSARTLSASQKRDIHEAIDNMYGVHGNRRTGGTGAGGQQTGGSSSGVSGASAEGSVGQQQQYYPLHHSKTASYHRHQAMDNGEEMSGDADFTGGDAAATGHHDQSSGDTFAREIPKWLFWLHPARTHLTLGEAHALVKSVINNGLVEKLDFKTLEHLTRKYAPGSADPDKDEDFIELHSETSNESADVADVSKRSGGSNKMTAVKFENEDPLNPEEELLTVKGEGDQNNPKEGQTKPNGDAFAKNTPDNGRSETGPAGGNSKDKSSSNNNNNNPFGSAIINEDLFKNYQNLEQVMEILMHSENTLKKRGEGPQLSIDSALTVLRERLLLELARRKAKATEKQIQINTEILKKLGRRRRRRSVADWQFVEFAGSDDSEKQPLRRQQQQQKQQIDCDETKCNLHDLNSKWSNVHQSLANLVGDFHVGALAPAPATPTADLNRNTATGGGESSHLSWRLRPYFGGGIGSGSSSQRFRNNDKYIAAFDAEDEDANDPQMGNRLEMESAASPAVSETSGDQDLFEGIKDVYQQHNRNRLTYSNSHQQQQQPATFLALSPLANAARIRINSRKPALRLQPSRPSAISSYRRAKLSRQWKAE